MIFALHSAIGVSSMERSIAFYKDLLGMKVLMDLDISDDRIGRVIGEPGAKCRIVHLTSGDAVLELFEYSTPKGVNRVKNLKQYDKGLTHIGFEVTGFHQLVAKLKDNNVEFLSEPVEFRPNVWVVYFHGPDGEVCELREMPKE